MDGPRERPLVSKVPSDERINGKTQGYNRAGKVVKITGDAETSPPSASKSLARQSRFTFKRNVFWIRRTFLLIFVVVTLWFLFSNCYLQRGKGTVSKLNTGQLEQRVKDETSRHMENESGMIQALNQDLNQDLNKDFHTTLSRELRSDDHGALKTNVNEKAIDEVESNLRNVSSLQDSIKPGALGKWVGPFDDIVLKSWRVVETEDLKRGLIIKKTQEEEEEDNKLVVKGYAVMKQSKADFPLVSMDSILEGLGGSPVVRSCRKPGFFSNTVNGLSVLVVMHEASLTGAPLATAELAGELVGCGAKVLAVVLNRKGGLIPELVRRGIKVASGKGEETWEAAAEADLVVVGSAACVSWIAPFLSLYPERANRLLWWLMENRREYFDLAKPELPKVGSAVFIADSQSALWHDWSKEESVVLPSRTAVISLSIGEDLARIAGVAESMTEEEVRRAEEFRRTMREMARKRMGLEKHDMLALMLSSITASKGQIYAVQAVLDVVSMQGKDGPVETGRRLLRVRDKWDASSEQVKWNLEGWRKLEEVKKEALEDLTEFSKTLGRLPKEVKGIRGGGRVLAEVQLETESMHAQEEVRGKVKLLVGSMYSKSNKEEYVDRIHTLMATYDSVALEAVMWTNSTLKVAPLYAAADVYIMNAQGIGETFGRVTVEAMAFGLPVLGTNVGGTAEIILPGVTGLLHPVGKKGIVPLIEHLKQMLNDTDKKLSMSQMGKARVKEKYLDTPMYRNLAIEFQWLLERAGRQTPVVEE